MCEVTVICCWNNVQQYTDFVSTLKMQSCPYALIGIDNRGNKAFSSCASAYNSVIDSVRTKYVIYSHQDILLKDEDCLTREGGLRKFVAYLSGLKRDAILGVAGVRFDTEGTFADFQHYDKQKKKFVPAGDHRLTSDLMECDTVDECFFGGCTDPLGGF